MSKRKNHSPEFRVGLELEALKGEKLISEFESWFDVYPPRLPTETGSS